MPEYEVETFSKFGKTFQEKLVKTILFDRNFANQMEEVHARAVDEIRTTAHTRISLSNDDVAELTGAFKKQISENVAEDLLKSLSERPGIQFDKTQLAELRSRAHQIKARLVGEVESLSRRGNLNLVIGGVTTVLAVGLLIYIVLNASAEINPEGRDLDALLWHYVPRLAVAIFIEVFSFNICQCQP